MYEKFQGWRRVRRKKKNRERWRKRGKSTPFYILLDSPLFPSSATAPSYCPQNIWNKNEVTWKLKLETLFTQSDPSVKIWLWKWLIWSMFFRIPEKLQLQLQRQIRHGSHLLWTGTLSHNPLGCKQQQQQASNHGSKSRSAATSTRTERFWYLVQDSAARTTNQLLFYVAVEYFIRGWDGKAAANFCNFKDF